MHSRGQPLLPPLAIHVKKRTRRTNNALPTAEQIDNNKRRALTELLRPSMSIFPENPTSQTARSPPADLEARVTRLASAYRTMTFRETLLYVKLPEAGARMAPLRSSHNGEGLSAHQEVMLLWELGQRGAFTDARVRPRYMGMTNRQLWNAHRAKGEVFTFETQHSGGWGLLEHAPWIRVR